MPPAAADPGPSCNAPAFSGAAAAGGAAGRGGRPSVLVMGASGRLGRFLAAAWAASPDAPAAIWQWRRPPPQCFAATAAAESLAAGPVVVWDPLAAPLPAAAVTAAAESLAAGPAAGPPAAGPVDAVLVLAGPRSGPDLARNADLARAGIAAARASGGGAGRAGAHVFLASSAAVYGAFGSAFGGSAFGRNAFSRNAFSRNAFSRNAFSRKALPPKALPPKALPKAFTENDPPAPLSDYGRAKAEMEAAAAAEATGGPGVTSLRIGNVAGADALLGGAGEGSVTLDRFADGRGPRRSYIGPESLAHVLARLIGLAASGTAGAAGAAGAGGAGDGAGAPGAAGAALPTTLNVAAPGPVAMADLLEAAGVAWRWRPAPPEAIAEVALDVSRLTALVPELAASAAPAAPAAPDAMVAEWRRLAGRS